MIGSCMKPRMHEIYTHIDDRSYKAFVESGSLDEVLCAFVVDPDEAEDVAKRYGVSGTPHSLLFLWTQSAGFFDAALQTIAQWVMAQPDAEAALDGVASWNMLLGIWCACAVSKEALLLCPDRQNRAKSLIGLTEEWVASRGSMPHEKIRAMVREVSRFQATLRSYAEQTSLSAAMESAALIWRSPDPSGVSSVSRYVAAALCDDGGDEDDEEFLSCKASEMLRLRSVVAEACLRFPAR
jgi:hypothetical protein